MRKRYVFLMITIFALSVFSGCSSGSGDSTGVSGIGGGRQEAVERNSALVGRWRNEDGAIEFFADGTAEFPTIRNNSSTNAKWHTDSGRLYLSYDRIKNDGKMEIAIRHIQIETKIEPVEFWMTDSGGIRVHRTDFTNEIYGEWYEVEYKYDSNGIWRGTQHLSLVLNRDGTGTHSRSEEQFTWYLDEENNFCFVYSVEKDVDYAVSDTEVKIFFESGMAYLSGTKTYEKLG